MPRATPLQPSLNAGEFSPRMAARTDFSKYPLACSRLENMVPLPQGGATRRPGTRYVTEVKDSTQKSRLLPFEFSEQQAYILEAGDAYLRVFKDQGQIVVTDTDGVITNGIFDSDITGWTDLSGAGSNIGWNSTNNDMNLISNGTTSAHAEQTISVAPGNENNEHVLKFRVRGTQNNWLKLRIGSTTGGTEIVDDLTFHTGYHCYAFTPGVTTFYVQYLHDRAKTVSLDNVAFIDNAPVEIDTPYAAADLATINFAQSADVMYLCLTEYPVHKLERSGHASWSLTEVEFSDGPYQKMNTGAATLAPSATSGLGITITASADVFVSTDIGRLLRIEHGSTWGSAIVTAFTSAASVTADVTTDFGGTTGQADWRLGSWSGTTGYPGIVYFFEQRLGFACTTNQPQTFWLSQSADFENMMPDDGSGAVADDDAIDYTISADQVNVIRWMSAYKDLIIGAAGGEWTVKSNGPHLTPTDVDVKRQTAYGSTSVDPALMRGRLVYLQKARRKILEFAYELDLDGFQSLDMTLLSDHITKGGIESMAYQQELDSILWCVRSDGVLPTFTYQPDQQVIGWSRQILGGSFDGGNAVAESVGIIPAADRDEPWIICKRTINGQTKRYIEFIESGYETNDAQDSAYYVDGGLTLDILPVTVSGASQADPVVMTAIGHGYSNGDRVKIETVTGMTELNSNQFLVANVTTNTFELTNPDDATNIDGTGFGAYVSGGQSTKLVTEITGLDHLEGETIKILAEGAVHPDRTVLSGQITLQSPCSKAHCGLLYSHVYESLKWEAGSPTGTAQGQVKRIDGVTLMLLDSLNAKIGPDETQLRTIPFRQISDNMDTAVPLFTGERFTEFDGDYGTDTRVCITGDDPVPFTLLALSPRIKVSAR